MNVLTSLDRPNSYIGRSVPRPNAKRLLAGRGRYVTDIVLPRMLHVAYVRSPYAHARIVSIDAQVAREMPGVKLVATGKDVARLCTPWVGTMEHFKGMKSPPQLPLPVDKVVWSGQAVVAVVADTRALAEDAAETVAIEFDELPAVVDIDAARVAGSPVISPELGSNLCFHGKIDTGGVDDVFANAAHIVEEEFHFGRHTAVTMEPRAIIADYDASEQQLTVHHATQTPYQFQDIYSRHYGIPESRVRVIAPDIGGSFGMKLHMYHEDMAVVGLSIMLGRPVKYVADRIESFVSDIHARDHRVRARMAVDAEGEILAMDVEDVTAIGAFSAYPRTSVVEGNQVYRLMGAPYTFRNYRADLQVVFQNKVQMSQYRAVGHPIACAVTERLVDMIAGKMACDVFEIRSGNLIPDDAYPCTSPTGYQFEALSHHACLARLRQMMDYDRLRAEQAELRTKGIHRGIGIATFVEITNPGPAFYGVGGARIGAADYSTFMPRLRSMRPDFLCISNFGRDQANSIKQAVDFGLKQQAKIVVPVILHNQRLAVGPEVFEGVVGGANYYWGLESQLPSAKAFNDAYRAANGGAIPTDYGAYGYTGLSSLLMAMQVAGGTDTDKVIAALEALKYDVAKGPQSYRKCDHQSVQSVLVLESQKKADMKSDADLFKVVANEPASEKVLRGCTELGFPA